MTIRVLFFPWSAGGGAGYTGRGLATATRLGADFACAFGPSAVESMTTPAGFSIIGRPRATPPPRNLPAYLPFANLERVYAVTARYYRRRVVSEHLTADLAAIDEYRPDVVVSDMQPTAVLAARIRGLPLVSLADTDFLWAKPNAWMPWSAAPPDAQLPHPSALEAINEVAVAHGLAPVADVTELLWGDVVIVPSSPEVEPPPPPPPGRPAPTYVGPVYWDPPGPPCRPERHPGRHHVYVSIGSGGMVGERSLREILDALDRPDMAVFLSTGFASADWIRRYPNVQTGGFTGVSGPIDWADLVVDHGGYSTVLAALERGRPQVVLPFMSEQEANGRQFVADHGAGLLARTTTVDPVSGAVTYVHRHGGASDDPVVPAADLAATVREALEDPGMADRAGYARAAFARDRSAADLAELFRRLVR
jgi:UDP:flavonoid glycosyltransferase YjiC (YdhE family)